MSPQPAGDNTPSSRVIDAGSTASRADLEVDANSTRVRVAERLEVVSQGTSSSALDRLADLAARLLDAPASQVSLLSDVQLIAGSSGLAPGATGSRSALADSLCTVTASGRRPLVVTDATADQRVAHLPPVTTGEVGAYLGVPLTDAAGNAVGALCVFAPRPRDWSVADVTTLQQLATAAITEMELSALSGEHTISKVVLDLALGAARIGVFDIDLVAGTRSWDDRMLELFGYSRADFDPAFGDLDERVHPADRSRVAASVRHAIETRGTYEEQYTVLLPDGRTRRVSARGRALCDEDGRTVRVLGAAQDTTDLNDAQARVAAMLESMAVGYLAMDGDWNVTYINAEGERIAATTRADLVGRSFWAAFPATVGSEFERSYRHAVATGQTATFDAYYPAPLNIWVEVRAVPEHGGLALYFLDITDRHAAQDAADRSSRRLVALGEIALALASARDLSDLVTIMAEQGLAALGADGGSVAVPDPHDPGTLLSYITANFGEDTRADFGRLPLDALLPVTLAATTGERVLLRDQAACEDMSAHVVAANAATGCQAWASMPLHADGQVIGVLTAGWQRPQSFEAELLDVLDTFAAQCAQALQRLHSRVAEQAATRAAHEVADQQASLAAITRSLAGADTEDAVLTVVADQGTHLFRAAGTAVCLIPTGVDPTPHHGPGADDSAKALPLRVLTPNYVVGDRDAPATMLLPDTPLPIVSAATTGATYFLADPAAAEALFPGAAAVYGLANVEASAEMPLRAVGQLLGSLSFVFAQPHTWTSSERDLLTAVAASVAQALARIRAHEAETTASRAVARLAETLQRSLLTAPAGPDHLQVAVRYVPAAAEAYVGGDWYDAFITAEGSTSLVIGDVAGHDARAAAAMGQLRNLLRGIGYAVDASPAAILSTLERAVHDLAVESLATIVLAQVHQTPALRANGNRLLRWSNAGHPPPLLIEPDGTTRFLHSDDPDLLVGLDLDAPRTNHEIVLTPGATVLFYTDGLVERRDATLDTGLAWLAGTTAPLAHLPLERLLDHLLEVVGDRVEDDVALLALRAHPEDEPRPPDAGPPKDPTHDVVHRRPEHDA